MPGARRIATVVVTHRLRPGLRARLLLTVVGLLALGTVAAGVTLRQVLLDRVDARVDRELDQELAEFRLLARRGSDPRGGGPLSADVRRLLRVSLQRNYPDQGESFFTYVDGRRFLTTADPRPSGVVLTALDRLERRTTGARRGKLRIGTLQLAYGSLPVAQDGVTRGTFVVTEDIGQQRREVTSALRSATLVLLAVLLVSLVVAYLVLTRALRPLRDLEATARSIGESDLTRRLEVRGSDEVAQLGRTFNAMLDRVETAFESQRALVSAAGHELRTPITIVRGHLELLEDDPVERRETLDLVEDELDRMGRLVDDLLTLAKSERADFLRLADTDVDVLTDEVLEKLTALGDRAWTLDARAVGRVTVDRQRLTQALTALAENAMRHTERGGVVAVGSSLTGGRLRLWVRDDGPGVPDDERARIFERFVRGRDARGDGTGLGLAIVSAIAAAHGGTVAVEGRSTFVLDLPAVAL